MTAPEGREKNLFKLSRNVLGEGQQPQRTRNSLQLLSSSSLKMILLYRTNVRDLCLCNEGFIKELKKI